MHEKLPELATTLYTTVHVYQEFGRDHNTKALKLAEVCIKAIIDEVEKVGGKVRDIFINPITYHEVDPKMPGSSKFPQVYEDSVDGEWRYPISVNPVKKANITDYILNAVRCN